MTGREVHLKQVLKDIHDGVGDRALMDKYRLSPKGLDHLYRHLITAGFVEQDGNGVVVCPNRKIPLDLFMHDLRAGFSKSDLKTKYVCSSKDLRKLVKELLASGAIAREDLQIGTNSDSPWIEFNLTPRVPRNYLPYPFAVYVVGDADARGTILDVTEQGFRVEGIEVRVGEVKTFSFIPSDIPEAKPFFLEGTCRWASKDSKSNTFVAGFQIVKLSERSNRELRKLIDALTPSAW